MSKIERASVSVLTASAVSLLPLFLPVVSFLAFPGALLTLLLLGGRFQLNFQAVRVMMNVIAWSMMLYFGGVLWKWGQTNSQREIPAATKVIFIFWLVLLVPWLVVAPLSGMAFDGGDTAEAYVFAGSVWTYPITVGVVGVFRKWAPWIVLLPLLNLAGCGASGLLHK
jgi:hypothetical protein